MTEARGDKEADINVTPEDQRDTDAQVIAESLHHPSTFALIFERHFAPVHRYAQRRVGVDAADEIAAETFLLAFDGRQKFDGRQPSARPWLLGIATNLMCRRWRDEQRQLAAYARALNAVSETRANIVAPPQAIEVDGDLAAALATLTRDDRDTLLLYVWADLGYQEIGDALAVPIGTVRSRISRARRLLRERLVPACECPSPRNPYVQTALAEEPDHG
jgi:RNA polymerase sigma factor (sigma-70 family)